MSVPKAVKKQEEEAQKLYEKAYSEESEEPEAEEAVAGETEETPEVEVEEPEVVNWQERAQEWEQKFNLMQGKYNAEVPALHQEIGAMRQYVSQFNTAPERIDDQPEQTVNAENNELLDKMKEDYGEEFADDLVKLVQNVAQQGIAPVAQSAHQANQHAVAFARDKYFSELSRLVPDWEDIVRDQQFVQFVQSPDEFTGHPRLSLMAQAENNFDAHRVAAFYNAYKKATGKPVGAAGRKMASVTPAGGGSRQTGRSASREQVVTRAEMSQFAKDMSLNKYAGREEEARKMQAKIDKAIANGWVV